MYYLAYCTCSVPFFVVLPFSMLRSMLVFIELSLAEIKPCLICVICSPVSSLLCLPVQMLDPAKRLGCDQQGGYTPLKDHTFFDDIDWENIPSQTPPKLLPYLPSQSKGEVALRSDINVRDEVNMVWCATWDHMII